jgi:transposase
LAVRRVLDGRSAAEVARFLGLHERTVRKWLNCYETKGADALAAKPPHGAKPKLTPDQEAEILSWFARNPTEVEFGFPTELWTGVRAAQLVQARMGVKMNSNYLIKWLRDRGITSQMVRRRARGHNEEEMSRWQREEWPRIFKKAAEFAAKIVMIDETGMLMRPLVRRSLAPRGNPMVMRYHSKHREKVSVQGALVLSSEGEPQALRCQMHVDSYVDGEKTAAFLRKLLRAYKSTVPH